MVFILPHIIKSSHYILECPTGYQNLVEGSEYCYRIVTEQDTWNAARDKCQEDGGELACYSNLKERDELAEKCDGCWVGYTMQNGRIPIMYYNSFPKP